jgi:hypothetical protein
MRYQVGMAKIGVGSLAAADSWELAAGGSRIGGIILSEGLQQIGDGATDVFEALHDGQGFEVGDHIRPAPYVTPIPDLNLNYLTLQGLTQLGFTPTPNDPSIGSPIPKTGDWIYGGNNAPVGSIVGIIGGIAVISQGPIFSNGGLGSGYHGPSLSGYAQSTYNGYGGGSPLQALAAAKNNKH